MNTDNLVNLARLISALKTKVKCFVCQDYIQNVVEIKCGHIFCDECINKQTLCPVCQISINRRCPIYRDEFLNSLSKFVDSTCQIIKEKYAQDVETLKSNNDKNIEEIIETAPQNIYTIPLKMNDPVDETKEEIADEFAKLVQNTTRTYSNRRKTIQNKETQKILSFVNTDTRAKVAKWLKENKDKFDVLTQSQTFLTRPNNDFDMISISQVEKNVKSTKLRSHSFTLPEEQPPNPLIKRYHSLTQGLSEDNYAIDDVQSEDILKQVERKVLQDMLEDECIENLESVAKQTKNKKTNVVRGRKVNKRNLNLSTSSLECSSGWDRMGDVKKSLKMTKKEPKKLKIVLQDTLNAGTVKDTIKKPDKKGKTKKSSPKSKISEQNKENPLKTFKNNMKVNLEVLKNKTDNIVEIENVLKKKDETIQQQNNNVSDDNVFLVATQRTTDSEKRKGALYVSPVPEEINDVDALIGALTDNFNKCIEKSKDFDDETSLDLVSCFSNLKTYMEKLQRIKSEQEEKEHTMQLSPVIRINIGTQTTRLNQWNKQTQTVIVQRQAVSQQTSPPLVQHVGIQTDKSNTLLSQDFTALTKTENEIIDVEGDSKIVNTVLENEISLTSRTLRSNNSKASSKDSPKIAQHKKIPTQSSVLLCSLKSTDSGKSVKKINKKLFDDESAIRKFKRIRHTSVSDSDDDGPPRKRKFIKDDLTVEFQDTENAKSKEGELALNMSDDMDYDKYLLEVMAKYGTPERDTSGEVTAVENKNVSKGKAQEKKEVDARKSQRQKTQQLSSGNGVFSGQTMFEENMDKFEQEIQKYEGLNKGPNTECDIVEDTPTVVQKPKKYRFTVSGSKESKPIVKEPFQIISRGSASNDKPVSDQKLLNVLLQHGTSTKDALNIIEDLKNDQHFFSEGQEPYLKRQEKKLDAQTDKRGLTENIDEILNDIDNFEDENEIEAELENISFTAEANKLNEKSKVYVLQNLKLQHVQHRDLDVIDSSDGSDMEIVETTPQKRKSSSLNKSSLMNLEDSGDHEDLGICLPPPPGFGDDVQDASQVIDNNRSSITKQAVSNSSLTPDRLSQLFDKSKRGDDEQLPEKAPEQYALGKSLDAKSLPQRSFLIAPIDIDDEAFSPIAKSTNVAKSARTPLVYNSNVSVRKPSMLTSTPNQKSILNYVRCSQDKSKPARSKPCVMWSRISNKDIKNVFKQLEMKRLITTSETFSSEVTHLLVAVDEKGQLKSHTAKFLLAVAAGIWVVRYEWAVDSLKMNGVVSEKPYEVIDISGIPGPQRSRLTGKKNPLFKGYRFFCAPTFSTISITDIENIVRMLDGEIADDLSAMFKADKIKIILTDTSATEDLEKFDDWLEMYKTVTVDIEWFIKCVAQYKLLSFRPFLLCSEDNVCDLNYPPDLVEAVPFVFTETL